MKPTIPYIEQKFEEFNQLMFAGKLPKLPIELSDAKTFLGLCVYKKQILANGKEEKFDFKLRINTRLDLPEREIEDTIIHEMIHYFIGVNQLEDTSSHGPLFLHIMENINEKFNRKLTVSYKSSKEEREQLVDTKPHWHVVAVVHFTNGKKGIKVLPRVIPRITNYYYKVLEDKKVQSIDLYMCNAPYFNRFPNSSALNATYVDESEFTPHLEGADRLVCDGNTIKKKI